MATHTTPTASTSCRRNEGAPEYPQNLADTPAEQGQALYDMLRENLYTNRQIEEFLFDLGQRVEALENKTDDVHGRIVAICSLQENQQLGLREIHQTLLPNHPDHKGKAKAEPTPGHSTLAQPKKKSLAERLGIPPSYTPWDPVTPVGNPPQSEQGSASEHQPSLLKRLQPLPLLQHLMSPN
jgi:hypothetical protein